MGPLAIALGLLGYFGGQSWLRSQETSKYMPAEIEAQEEVSATKWAREMKGLGMMSDKSIAQQEKMWGRMEEMQEKQYGRQQEAGIQSQLMQMAMGMQEAGAAEGQAFVAGAMQPEQAMLPGTGLVDALR